MAVELGQGFPKEFVCYTKTLFRWDQQGTVNQSTAQLTIGNGRNSRIRSW